MSMFGGVIIWVFIIGLAVWGFKRFTGARREGRMHLGRMLEEPPIEIARKRLAHGEITHEEFEELKRDLQ